MPPELSDTIDEGAGEMALGGRTDLLRQLYFRSLHGVVRDDSNDRALVELILEHARKVIAHPAKPRVRRLVPWTKEVAGELALEESLEEDPFLEDPDRLFVEHSEEKRFSFTAMLDCSSSMSGDKHLLASIAVAVLLLEVPSAFTAVSVFHNDAKAIKGLRQAEPVEATVLRFLRTRPKGFTNISAGLEEGLRQFGRVVEKRRRVGILATDGRYTEGEDPAAAAARYDFLVVLHLHGPGSTLEASQRLAQLGHGLCLEVARFEELPKRLYEALRLLSRR